MNAGFGDDDEEDEDALWSYVTRDIEPFSDRDVPEKIFLSRRPAGGKEKRISFTSLPDVVSAPAREKSREVDRRTDLRLRRGQMDIEALLDLHGMNREQAQMAVRNFVLQSYKGGLRHILVITGKGGRSTGSDSKGVLRQAVPGWLDEPPLGEIVLQYAQARPRHGGDGAFYILLRRRR